jgi:hypothetical protein
MPARKSVLRTLLDRTLIPLIALLLIFEEWGWEPLSRWLGLLAALPLWARMERRIEQLPPHGALLIFIAPAISLFPIKLLALYLIGEGHTMLGLALVIAAKVVGTAIVARLFQLTQPALMRLPWFARWYGRWKRWKDRLIARVKRSAAWHSYRGNVAVMRRRGRLAWRRMRAAFA